VAADGVDAGEEEGDIPRIEYDYLLSMPMWNLSQEKIEELIRLMNEKKRERTILEAKHVHEIWNEELDHFEKVLTTYEEKEEKERLASAPVKHDRKKQRKKPVVKKEKNDDIQMPK